MRAAAWKFVPDCYKRDIENKAGVTACLNMFTLIHLFNQVPFLCCALYSAGCFSFTVINRKIVIQ